jgi:hemerythrin-like metal-binding protein
MAMFQWSDVMSVGVASMDHQHKQLFQLINQLYEAMQAGKGDQLIQDILMKLSGYTRTHFAAEEEILRKIRYPGLNSQIALHKAFVDKVGQMTRDVKGGKKIATVSLATFLKDWLVTHIQKEDRQYGLYIQHQNLAGCP